MSESFVPLLPHLARGTGTQTGSIPTQVLSANGAGSRFFPMADREPKPAPANSYGATATAAQACASQPRVTLVREGDIVKRIQVQCGCGQLIELDCV